jgi:hypothetical protein
MQNNRRFTEIIVGLFLLMLGASGLFEGGNPLVVLLAIVGFYMLYRQFEVSRENRASETPRRSYPMGEITEDFDAQTGKERIYRHALQAVKEAGLDPDQVRVLVTDIGFMAFKGDQDPVVHRSRPVPDDVEYIQPFVQLRVPTKAVGRIRFEIIDSDGQVLFVREENHQLERGRNLISPAARLPIHDAQAMHDSWELRISADGMPLAGHFFDWEETSRRAVRRHLTEDGEITGELRTALATNRLEKVSLDDLLADQEDDSENERQQRRS